MTLLSLLLFFAALPAFGYVDPGTGSYLLQMLIGSILGLLFLARQFRYRIMEFLRKVFRKKGP